MTSQEPSRIGGYDILETLGKGAMGQVYKAVQPSLNRIVALKVLPPELASDPERVERFDREAQAIALLNHPNVVNIIDRGHDADRFFFVMEYVAGTSLSAVLSARRLSLPETITVFKMICRGLQAAHRKGIVHRDLNPRNVLVSDDLGVVKLADFGISRVESISLRVGTLSTAEVSMGTMHYMAPEQAVDMGAVDQRADIYSAGVVLYEMLTGRVPVGRFSLPSQLNTEAPSALDPIVLRCLATDPADRYPSVDQLLTSVSALENDLRFGVVQDLRGLSRSTSKILRRSTQKFWTGRSPRRRAALAAAGAVIAVAVLLGVWLSTRSRTNAPATTEDPVNEYPLIESPLAGGPFGETPAVGADTAQLEPDQQTVGVPATANGTPAPAPTPGVAKPRPATPIAPAAKPATTPATTTASAAAPGPAPARPKVDNTLASDTLPSDLKVARDKLEAGLIGPALEDLGKLIADHPTSPLLLDAYLLVALGHEREGRLEEAKAALVEIRSRFASDPRTAEAIFRLAELTVASKVSGKEQLARDLFWQVPDSFPNSEWAPRALVKKAGLESDRKLVVRDETLGIPVPALLVTHRRLADEYPTDAAAEGALWALGEMYADLKRYDLAVEAYTKLAEQFPNTKLDAWWEAGQIYDRRLDDAPKASEAFGQVPSTSKNYSAAQKRLKRIGG